MNYKSTDNDIRDEGAEKISQALKENSGLTELNLSSDNQLLLKLINENEILSTGNRIGITEKLSQALKENSTLTILSLNCDNSCR